MFVFPIRRGLERSGSCIIKTTPTPTPRANPFYYISLFCVYGCAILDFDFKQKFVFLRNEIKVRWKVSRVLLWNRNDLFRVHTGEGSNTQPNTLTTLLPYPLPRQPLLQQRRHLIVATLTLKHTHTHTPRLPSTCQSNFHSAPF